MWTYKFGDGKKLKSLHTASLPSVITGIKVTIINNVVNSHMILLLSKDAMSRANIGLRLENISATMLRRKVPVK